MTAQRADLDLRGLEAFVAVAVQGSFTGAGRELRFAQSTVSRHVQQLERALGLVLLVRTPRRVELTAHGRAFLPQARRVLEAAREAAELAGTLASNSRP